MACAALTMAAAAVAGEGARTTANGITARAAAVTGKTNREGAPVRDMVPLFEGNFDGGSYRSLRLAFRVAAQRIEDVPQCAALFSSLGADGVAKLRATHYLMMYDRVTVRGCGRGLGPAAFTHVGSSRTMVCPGFDRLPVEAAAMIVIHEALHYAGLGEKPSDPRGPEPDAINHSVRAACHL